MHVSSKTCVRVFLGVADLTRMRVACATQAALQLWGEMVGTGREPCSLAYQAALRACQQGGAALNSVFV